MFQKRACAARMLSSWSWRPAAAAGVAASPKAAATSTRDIFMSVTRKVSPVRGGRGVLCRVLLLLEARDLETGNILGFVV